MALGSQAPHAFPPPPSRLNLRCTQGLMHGRNGLHREAQPVWQIESCPLALGEKGSFRPWRLVNTALIAV